MNPITDCEKDDGLYTCMVLSSQRFISLRQKRLRLGGRSVNITARVLQSNLQKVLTSAQMQNGKRFQWMVNLVNFKNKYHIELLQVCIKVCSGFVENNNTSKMCFHKDLNICFLAFYLFCSAGAVAMCHSCVFVDGK